MGNSVNKEHEFVALAGLFILILVAHSVSSVFASHANAPNRTETHFFFDDVSKFDEYGAVPFAREKKHLDRFAKSVLESPNTIEFVLLYAVHGKHFNVAVRRACRISKYLIHVHHLDSRILKVLVISSTKTRFFRTELWITPDVIFTLSGEFPGQSVLGTDKVIEIAPNCQGRPFVT
jgi:hypothetical protein